MAKVTLLAAVVADGSGTAYTIEVANGDVPVQDAVFGVIGTFGAGTVKLEFSADGTNYIDVTSASVTAEGTVNVKVVDGYKYRATVTGSTTPSLSAYLMGVSVAPTVTSS